MTPVRVIIKGMYREEGTFWINWVPVLTMSIEVFIWERFWKKLMRKIIRNNTDIIESIILEVCGLSSKYFLDKMSLKLNIKSIKNKVKNLKVLNNKF